MIPCHCSVCYSIFGQSWPRIFLVQCQGNLFNVGVVFAATSYDQKINWSKIKITIKVILFR